MSPHPFVRAAVIALAFCAEPASAGDAGSDVQRMLQQREQQQMELRLKMQQQQDRAVRPPSNPASDFRLRQLERDQQQRQQQGFDIESREAASRAQGASPDAARALRQSQAGRSAREDAEQEQRYRSERDIEAARPGSESAPGR